MTLRAGPEPSFIAQRLRVGRIPGGADVERDGEVGPKAVGGHRRPAQAQLLLDGE